MIIDDFVKVLDAQIKRVQNVLIVKTAEYANADQLHNFRVAAELQDKTVKETIAGMMAKHTVSIYDMVRSKRSFDPEIWDEKITDHIIYLILLRAAVIEEAGIKSKEN